MTDGSPLGSFEVMVLLAVLKSDPEPYATAIRDEIRDWTGKRVTRGAVYATLERLEDKGLLSSRLGEPTPERGGRARRLYRATDEGLSAVRRTRRILSTAFGGLREILDEA